jgi:signal transduction histidine kinase
MSSASSVATAGERRRRAPTPAVLWAIGIAGCVASALTMSMAFSSERPEPGLQGALSVWIQLPYIVGGLIAWWRRPDSRFGPLMVIAGWVAFITTFSYSTLDLPYTVGQLFDLLPVALFLHVFLAYPTGRLEHRPERFVVGVAYTASVALQIAKMLLGSSGPDSLVEVTSSPGAAETLEQIELATLSAALVAGVALLFVRRWGSLRTTRRPITLLVNSYALALAMLAVLLIAALFSWPSFETIHRIAFAAIGLAPAVFLTGLLSARLARADVGDLLVALDAHPAPGDLRKAISQALRDPSLTLAYRLSETNTWADAEGRPVEVPSPDPNRATTLIEREGVPIAALLHDPSLEDERELLGAVSAAGGIALENARLQAELQAQIQELRGSRARVIDAEQKERQRLERNLHDGAQQRLISLSLDLGELEASVGDDPQARARLEQARAEVGRSLEELRDIARGIHPAVLTDHGLAVALQSLAKRAPVPVRLEADFGEDLPQSHEVAAYYVVSESLANVSKHAEATSARVEVARSNGELVVEVIDDGVGRADAPPGSGLRGLVDRVEALDGSLVVTSPRAGGTSVRAAIPCP